MDTTVKPGSNLRFLFTSTPYYGHFHPLVPTALALQEAGHEVAFAVPRHFCAAIEKAGFQAFPAGYDGHADPEFQALMGELAQMPPGPESEMIVMTKVFCGLGPRRMVPDLLKICESWQPDLIIREAAEYGGSIAAEHLGLPHAAISPAAYLQGINFFEHDAARHLDPVRQQWGLPPDPTGEARYRYLLLNFTPPSYAISDPQQGYPASSQFYRPEFYDQSGDETLPDWVAQLPQQPTVYVTLGTEVNQMPGFYPGVLQTIIAGLRDEPINLIVTVGRDKDPADFGPQPASVHIERYIPHTLLMPNCDLMVMHGGSNSLLLCIDRALPMVLLPLIADQFLNGQRCTEMVLAPVVGPEQQMPEGVRDAVREALHNPLYRQNILKLQTELHNLSDLRAAVRALEEVAWHRTPQLQR